MSNITDLTGSKLASEEQCAFYRVECAFYRVDVNFRTPLVSFVV